MDFPQTPAPRAPRVSQPPSPGFGGLRVPAQPLQAAIRVTELRHSARDGISGPSIVLLAQGTGWLDCGSLRTAMSGPTLVLLPGGMHPRMRVDTEARGSSVMLEKSFAHLTTAREPAFAALFREPRTLSLARSGAAFRDLEATIASLARELSLAAAARLTAMEAHLQLLLTGVLRLLEQASPPGTLPSAGCGPGRPERLVSEFLRLAAAHGRQRWHLGDYARTLRVSAGYLRAACARVTGSSPVQLIHEWLMREAKHRLVSTELPIGAIAQELGFEDAAYFSRLFHAKSGVSPKQYRSSYRTVPAVIPPMIAQ